MARTESRSLENPFPLGSVDWISEMGEVSVLRLSTCNVSQFGCHDGLCVDIQRRCDMIHDCHDKSDEVDCHTLRNVSKFCSVESEVEVPKVAFATFHENYKMIVTLQYCG